MFISFDQGNISTLPARTTRSQAAPPISRTLHSTGLNKLVGEATLPGEEENKISIKTGTKDPNKYYFINDSGKKLGYIELTSSSESYGPDNRQASKRNLYVSYIKSHGGGIGTLMHEFAVVLSKQKGFKGRVTLLATNGSHIFHYLSGFRSSTETHIDDDKSIELAIEFAEGRVRKGTARSKKDYDTSYLGHMHMYLPENKISEILGRGNITIY